MPKFSKLYSLIFFLLLSLPSFHTFQSQELKEYKLSDKPYGLAYDGTNFWYIDTDRRALFKINEIGQQEVFNLGLANLRGITFDGREGRILVTSSRVILKVEPNTGGVTEKINVPITNIGGIASVGGVYYILDIDTGKVHIYDKSTSMIVGGFLTDRAKPRDICYGRESLWISDSSDGTIYRYDTRNGQITGSVRSNGKNIRGIVFSGSRLWVVDNEQKEIKTISFTETERFIASNEANYTIEVKLVYSLNSVTLSKASVAVLMPPTNEQQRTRLLRSSDNGFKEGFIGGQKALIKKLSVEDTAGGKQMVLKFKIRTQNLKYFVGDDFFKNPKPFPNDITNYRLVERDRLDWGPELYLNELESKRQASLGIESFRKNLLVEGFPVKPSKVLIVKGKSFSIAESTDVYINNFGWVPTTHEPPDPKAKISNRYFESSESQVTLYESNTFNGLESPVFFQEDKNSEWKPIPAEFYVKLNIDPNG